MGSPATKPSEALALHVDAVRRAVRRHRAVNPRIFGSAAAGEDRADSDLDVLVDVLPDTTLFDLGALQVELETLLRVPVDVLTIEDLPARLRASVLAQAQPL